MIESACVNRGSTQEITNASDFTNLAKNLKSDQSVVLLVHHNKDSRFIYLSPTEIRAGLAFYKTVILSLSKDQPPVSVR